MIPDRGPETPPRVLVVDDEEVIQDVLEQLFRKEGMQVVVAASGEAALDRLAQDEFDLVLLDLMLPGISGIEVLGRIKRASPDLPVVMVTAYATVETAIEAMKAGAFEYLVKPFRNDELVLVARRAIAAAKLSAENRYLRRELHERNRLDNLVGRSEAMQRVFALVEQASPSRSTILIEGESGTGKELIARAIHHASPRAEGRFVVVHCGSLPDELQESTLFGHVAGAFPGADRPRKGLFELADGGSLFFDEVSTIHLGIQAKLLRVLQEREFTPVGTSETVPADVRIIAATNSSLAEAVRAGKFREDLYYRLKVISIPLPPLRARTGDVPLLAAHFLQVYATENGKKVRAIHPEAMRLLESWAWPGNVRELENVIQKAVVLSRGEEIGPELVADDVKGDRKDAAALRQRLGGASYKELVDEFEREVITAALREADGVQKRAAALLQLKPTTLNEKIKRLGIRARP